MIGKCYVLRSAGIASHILNLGFDEMSGQPHAQASIPTPRPLYPAQPWRRENPLFLPGIET
jgi:hypothetical protein